MNFHYGWETMQLFYLVVCLLKVKMLALKLLKVNAKIFVSCMFFVINRLRLLLS